MSDDRIVGGLAVDDKVLIGMRRPEPSSHPDPRMSLELCDVYASFGEVYGERRERVPLPLKSSKW